jgi:hypothetical protein
MSYTRVSRNKSKLRLTQGIDTDSDDTRDLEKKFDKQKMKERQRAFQYLLGQVRNNKQLFLNNKLDELLNQFGDRSCRSMLDEPTGWQLIDDP